MIFDKSAPGPLGLVPIETLTFFVGAIIIVLIIADFQDTVNNGNLDKHVNSLISLLKLSLPFLYAGFGFIVLTTPEYKHRGLLLKGLLGLSAASVLMITIGPTSNNSLERVFQYGNTVHGLAAGSAFFLPMLFMMWHEVSGHLK
jgi:hypothetical protein